MKSRYFIFISYKGTLYHGWQVQPNSVTVQKIMEEALSTVLNENVVSTGAGRTDTGVHARFFCAHFESNAADLNNNNALIARLNRFLPADISVSKIRKVNQDAHARFSAVSRTYSYFISDTKDPFCEDSCWYLKTDLDLEKMNKACMILLETSDFTSFSKLHTDVKTNNCRVISAGWKREKNLIIFTIKADRFLRNMVRAIVGTMVDLGRGRISEADFKDIIEARDRCRAGKSAPAKGLFLEDIEYPGDIFAD